MEPGVFNSEILKLDFRTSEYPKATITPNLVLKNPSAQAKKLYQYLIETYQKKTISGMMANVAWNNTESERVYALTGKYPALNCYDYIHLAWSPANWIDYGDITPVKSWWTAGGIVSIGWHWNVPTAEGVTDPSQATCTPEKTTFRAKNALTEGTWENTIMKADLAKITTYLKLLQAEGIPVLWRPLHEAAGNTYEYTGGTAWFWWGYDGTETYKQLWQYMFNYFEKEGLNNLIWVWTTQTKDNAFYPGDAYVDIIGRDLYNQSASNCALQYNIIVPNYPTKLVALSECGTVGLISEQWAAGAYWSWFMPWYDNADATSTHADDKWWKDAMNQPFVISRDQLPNLK
ncbi:beta-mannosidase [Bacteroides sp. 214]|nr:beta-mannosidase [Bacteroides sp. 214]